jgi:hypothetical protein
MEQLAGQGKKARFFLTAYNKKNAGTSKNSSYDKLKSKNFEEFIDDNHNEYHYPCSDEGPHVPLVTGLDIVGFHELYDHEKTNKRQDKEKRQVYPLCKEHSDGNNSQPQGKSDCGDLFLSHQDPFSLNSIPFQTKKGHLSK